MGEFHYQGHRIEYDAYGEGDRAVVLAHGLLMNRRMYGRLGAALAERGNRAICVDLLGHGRSDRPEDLRLYSMPLFARQTDGGAARSSRPRYRGGGGHLARSQRRPGAGDAQAGAGQGPADRDAGTRQRPVRGRGHFRPGCARPAAGSAGAGDRRPPHLGDPRTNYLLDIGLDWIRQSSGPSLAVLEGLLLGETAPHQEERRKIAQPTLIVGHPRDPLHPFSDSGMLAEELANGRLVEANSILEWRLSPKRLDAELAAFLADVWAAEAIWLR